MAHHPHVSMGNGASLAALASALARARTKSADIASAALWTAPFVSRSPRSITAAAPCSE
jgi:hypothetical protein